MPLSMENPSNQLPSWARPLVSSMMRTETQSSPSVSQIWAEALDHCHWLFRLFTNHFYGGGNMINIWCMMKMKVDHRGRKSSALTCCVCTLRVLSLPVSSAPTELRNQISPCCRFWPAHRGAQNRTWTTNTSCSPTAGYQSLYRGSHWHRQPAWWLAETFKIKAGGLVLILLSG